MERSSTTVQQIAEFVTARIGLIKKGEQLAAVGVVNTMVDFAVFATAVKVLGLPLIPANLMSWCVAVSCSYVLNSYTTFAAEIRSPAEGARLRRLHPFRHCRS